MEAMAVETLLAGLWELDGYLTKTRIAYKIKKNAYSDIDVIGLKKNDLRIGECKARFGPREVMIVTQKDAKDFFWGWLGDWSSSFSNLEDFWNAGYDWLPTSTELKNMEIWFCANIYFEAGAYDIAIKSFKKSLYDKLPNNIKDKLSNVEIISTYDVFFNIFKGMDLWDREYNWSKRFGNPILDSLREMYRYLSCRKTHFGGRSVYSEEIKEASLEKFKDFFKNDTNENEK